MLLPMDTAMEKETGLETIDDNDTQQKVEKLLAQITELKSENQKSNEEFGIQRGKMKELFLQKEEDLKKLQEEIRILRDQRDDARSQVTIITLQFESRMEEEKTKYQSQISELHTLVNATLEEASVYDKEINQLRQRNQELENELKTLSPSNVGNSSNKDSESVPMLSTPGAMLSTFARKVASQLGAVETPAHHGSTENLEESMRKAKEDAEVLRSLVVPLEEEISALKTKLRKTDEQLQLYKAKEQKNAKDKMKSKSSEDIPSFSPTAGTNSSGESVTGSPQKDLEHSKGKPLACEMCLNYERELVDTQRRVTELEKELSVMDRLKEELQRESVFRKQMEEKWQESKEHHKQGVTELQQKLEASESSLNELRQTYLKTKDEMTKQFAKLADERKTTQDKLERLQLENENLVGKYNRHSQELQNEEINLPNTVEALQEMWLAQREELIKARVGLEHSEESVRSLEILYSSSEEKQLELTDRLAILGSERTRLEQELTRKQTKLSHLEHLNGEWRRALEEQKAIVLSLQADKKKLEDSENELRLRLVSLQTGLENGEAVQKDFVRLSQSLQKELERLRGQNNVLRWEHEDDVSECRGCEQPFKSAKGKLNCRHCGRIFCSSCLSHKVYTGRSQRESRVCQVCHTLLDSKTAPYFSTGPPPQPN